MLFTDCRPTPVSGARMNTLSPGAKGLVPAFMM
jgi:hypothetical protein